MLFLALFAISAAAGCGTDHLERELAYREEGISRMEGGDYKGAVESFDLALGECIGRIRNIEIDISYYKAQAQYAAGDAAGAISTCDALAAYDPKDPRAYYLRGCLLLKAFEYDKALKDFERAIDCGGDDYELYVDIYENLAASDMREDGERILGEALSIKGDDADHLAWRGRIYLLLGQHENALTELNAAIKKGSVDAQYSLGQLYDELGDSEMAEGCYKAYIESGEPDAAAIGSLVGLEMEKGDYAAALSFIGDALAMEDAGNRQELMRDEVICLERTGDFEGAWEAAQEYAKEYPDDVDAQREYTFLKYRQAGAEANAATDAKNDGGAADAGDGDSSAAGAGDGGASDAASGSGEGDGGASAATSGGGDSSTAGEGDGGAQPDAPGSEQ